MNALHGSVARRSGFETRPYKSARRSSTGGFETRYGRTNRRNRAESLCLMLPALLTFLLPAYPLQAQSLAELAAYAGPNRTQRLVAGAKKEGALMIYSSMIVADMGALINAFRAKYGIRVQQWRGSSEDIRNRAAQEYAAGRYEVDVAETAGPDMGAMVREQLLQKIATPAASELIPEAVMPHGQWIATRLSVFAGAHNTDIIKPAAAPKTYEDLLDPRFKGKLGIEVDDANWFMTVVLPMGEEKGLRLFKNIAARNGISIRKGHTLLANLVPTGEVPLALTAYSYRVDQLIHEGAPVAIDYLPPVIALPTGGGVFRRAPHPNAALLFEDFMLTDGQSILAARQAVPTNLRVKAPPPGLLFIDIPKFMDQQAKWTRLFQETFSAR
jgi:iron(III) transport system substrate-binding protein